MLRVTVVAHDFLMKTVLCLGKRNGVPSVRTQRVLIFLGLLAGFLFCGSAWRAVSSGVENPSISGSQIPTTVYDTLVSHNVCDRRAL